MNKSRLLLGVIFCILILFSTEHVSLLPSAHAAEPSLQAKSLSILSDIVGIKTDQYTITNNAQRESESLDAVQKQLNFNLVSAGSSLRVTCSYVKDTLKLVYLSDLDGNLKLKQAATNTVDAAKSLLSSYQREAGDAAYGEFASMLNNVGAGENVTKVSGNVKLEVSTPQKNTTSYMWTYIDGNGVVAERKNVCLNYQSGTLQAFYNNWPLYTIADTASKFSAKEATELAIEASKNYSYTVTEENGTEKAVFDFSIAPESLGEAKLIYVNSKEQVFARGGDPFRMYLAWYVPLGFDKFYPGDVSGLTVILWADTGEVCGMDRVIVDSNIAPSITDEASGANETQSLPTEATKPTPPPVSNPVLGITPAVGMVGFSLVACKGVKSGSDKKRFSKSWAVMFCLLMVFSVLFFVVPTASATPLTGNSRAYYTPQASGYHNQGADYAENASSVAICNYIDALADGQGYTSSSEVAWQASVYAGIDYDESHYDGSMLFYVGHQDGENRIQDNSYKAPYSGSSDYSLTASDVMSHTTGKHFFAFIWVCKQAPLPGQSPGSNSMAAAWLHRDGSAGHPLLGADGFADPDPMGQCYISFNGFSPMLSTDVNQSCGYYYNFADVGSLGPCSWFVMKFYYYALCEDYSVHDALDIASGEFFDCDYSHTVLNTGYNSWWPGDDESDYWLNYPDVPEGTHDIVKQLHFAKYYPRDFDVNLTGGATGNCMRVLGDSSIHLTAPPEKVNLAITSQTTNGNPCVGPVCIDNYLVGSGSSMDIKVTKGIHAVYANSWHYRSTSLKINDVSHQFSTPYNFVADSTVDITWTYVSMIPQQMQIIVGGDGGGTVDPCDWIPLHDLSQNVAITATPDYWYVLDRWVINGDEENAIGPETNPLILPAVECIVEVFFTLRSTVNYTLTVSCNGGGTTDPVPTTHEYFETTLASVTAIPNGGYTLNYWLLDGTPAGSNPTIQVEMNQNHSLQAIFRELYRYEVTLLCGGGGYTNPQAGVYENVTEGSYFTATAYPDSNYRVCWYLDSQLYLANQSVTFNVTGDCTLEARFIFEGPRDDFGNMQIFGGCSDIQGIVRGQVFVCPNDCIAESITAAVRSDVTGDVGARFAIYRFSDFSLIAQTHVGIIGAQGVLEPDWLTLNFTYLQPVLEENVQYLLVAYSVEDSAYAVQIASDYGVTEGYMQEPISTWPNFPPSLQSLYYGGESYSIYCTIIPAIPVQHSYLTIYCDGNGTTTPALGTHDYLQGTIVNVAANPNEGYTLNYWLLDEQPVYTNPLPINMNINHTLIAYFRPLTNCTLIVSSEGSGTTNPSSGTYLYTENTRVNITATPASGYLFEGWFLDSVAFSQNPDITLTMVANCALQASFVLEEYHWVSSIVDDSSDWLVCDVGGLVGCEPDGLFASILGYGPYFEYGWIVGAMDSQATGRIYLYGSGGDYSGGCVFVYVSSDGYNWVFVSDTYVVQGAHYWVDCGSSAGSFDYVLLTAEHPYCISCLEVDCVRVEPL